MPTHYKFAETFRKLMKKFGGKFSSHQISEKAQTHRTAISKWSNDICSPKKEYIRNLLTDEEEVKQIIREHRNPIREELSDSERKSWAQYANGEGEHIIECFCGRQMRIKTRLDDIIEPE